MPNSDRSLLPPRWILSLIFALLSVWLVFQLKELFVLLVVGYFIAYAVDPLIRRLERLGLTRPAAFGVLSLCAALLLTLICLTALPVLYDEFSRLSVNLNSYLATSRDKLGPELERLKSLLPEGVRERVNLDDINGSILAVLSSISGDTFKRIGRGVIDTLLSGYSGALALFNLMLLPFIIFYLAVDLPKLHGFLRGLVPMVRRSKVDAVFAEIDLYVSSFVRGQAIVCSVLFVLYALGLGLVGVDLWLLLAAIAGFGNMVPYLGTALGLFLSALMAVVTFGDLSSVAWVLVVFGVVHTLEGFVITPRVIGGSLGLSPLIIILALFAGGQLLGLLGIFLAIPAAATLRVLAKHSYRWALAR